MKIYTDFEDFSNDQFCSVWVATAIIGGALVNNFAD